MTAPWQPICLISLADDYHTLQSKSCVCPGADCGNLATYICTAYSGEKPAACYKTPDFKPCPGAPVTASSLSLD